MAFIGLDSQIVYVLQDIVQLCNKRRVCGVCRMCHRTVLPVVSRGERSDWFGIERLPVVQELVDERFSVFENNETSYLLLPAGCCIGNGYDMHQQLLLQHRGEKLILRQAPLARPAPPPVVGKAQRVLVEGEVARTPMHTTNVLGLAAHTKQWLKGEQGLMGIGDRL
jgi:hypothetical protein